MFPINPLRTGVQAEKKCYNEDWAGRGKKKKCVLGGGGVECGMMRHSPEGLSILDKDALYATNWKHPEDEVKDRIHGQIKCAEVLVPNGVNARFIRHAYVVNELGLKAFEKFGVQLRVEIKSGMFFPV
ncbi:MAG: DUF4433 domain-containing protein [Elusimicrobia bacterium]|nr:DUF4433 domain-containing protein [Elusimicrobiota bacterium]